MLHNWWSLLQAQISEITWPEWLSVALAVAEVLYARANKIWLYPAGLAGTLIGTFVLYTAGLYAECLLNGYYMVMSIYGWWYWVKKKNEPPVKATYCNFSEWRIAAGISIGGTAFLYAFLRILPLYISAKHFTPSTVPLWDAFVSATAWAGMWLLARRKIENWVLLNLSNAFAVPLLLYKHLFLYALLTIFLFIVAVQGYIRWRKMIREEAEPYMIMAS